MNSFLFESRYSREISIARVSLAIWKTREIRVRRKCRLTSSRREPPKRFSIVTGYVNAEREREGGGREEGEGNKESKEEKQGNGWM